MTRTLPPQPNLEHLKNEAKNLRNMHKRHEPDVCPLLRRLHHFADATDDEILAADVSLTDVQFALAMDYGFDSWHALRGAVSEMVSPGARGPDEDAEVIGIINRLLMDAIQSGTSELHFEPFEKSYRVRFRIEGRVKQVAEVPVELGPKMAARLKVMSRLDISERRTPQVGRIRIKISKTEALDFRISTLPVLFGEKITMRLLDPSSAKMGLDTLGFEPEQKALFLEALDKPSGLLLVAGPVGSGKTVTLYTGLDLLNKRDLEIYTVEDVVEINIEGVNQCDIVGSDFESVVRSCLQHDPDVLLVGAIRDAATAGITLKAAQTGRLVLAALESASPAEALTRLRQMGVPAYNLARAVNLVVSQRLLPRLCPECKVTADIPRDALIEAGFAVEEVDAGVELFEPVGCDECRGGYKGRVGIYEVVKITPAISRVIMEGGSAPQIAEACRQAGFPNLRQSALRTVKGGHASLDEVYRVTSGAIDEARS